MWHCKFKPDTTNTIDTGQRKRLPLAQKIKTTQDKGKKYFTHLQRKKMPYNLKFAAKYILLWHKRDCQARK